MSAREVGADQMCREVHARFSSEDPCNVCTCAADECYFPATPADLVDAAVNHLNGASE